MKFVGLTIGIVLLLVVSMWSALAAAPVVNAIADQVATVDEQYAIVVTATDADVGDLANLAISEADSDLQFLKVDATNKMKLVGTPVKGGDFVIKVVVTDGKEKSQVSSFKIHVNDVVLGIKNDATFTITIAGKSYTPKDALAVSPGDKVTLAFTYNNNFISQLLGYVQVSATSNLKDDFVAYISKVWAVKPGSYPTSIQFVVPSTIVDDKFTVSVKVGDETATGKKYGDQVDLLFTVTKKIKNAFINSVSVSDDTVTCSKVTTTSVEIVNNGINALGPEVWVLNQPASGIGTDGKPVTSATVKVHFPDDFAGVNPAKIDAGKSVTVKVPVDLSKVSGAQTLYVYIVSPWFVDDNGNFVFADSKQIAVKNVGVCLKTDAVQNALFIAKNAQAETSVDLLAQNADGTYKYIDEDKKIPADYGIVFSIPVNGQTNKALVDCSVKADGHTLSCAKPAANKEGSSDLSIQVDEKTLKSSFTEKATVKVAPILRLSVVDINGKTVEDVLANGLSVNPLSDVVIHYKLSNALDEKLVAGLVYLDDATFKFATQSGFNLKNKEESGMKTFKVSLPASAVEGKYDLTLWSKAVTDFENKAQQDSFAFSINVKQKADLQVLAKAKESTLACKSDDAIDVTITNIGKVEKTGTITIKEASLVLGNAVAFKVAPNGGIVVQSVPITVSTPGKHSYSVSVDYDFDVEKFPGNTVTTSADISKDSCLDVASALPAGNSIVIMESQSQLFSVKVNKVGFENLVTWYVDDVQVANGLTYTFSPGKLGVYKVQAKLNGEQTNLWTVTVSNKPVTQNLKTNMGDNPTKQQLAAMDGLTVETKSGSFGKIEYVQKVDLTNVLDLDKAITIADGLAGVDSANYPGLNKPAKITLYKTFTTPVILKVDEKGQSAVCTTCTILGNTNGQFVFSVDGFSTYKVQEKQAVGIAISTIPAIENVDLGNTTTFSFIVTNTGTVDALNNVVLNLADISKYSPKVIDDVVKTLGPGQSDNVVVQITVPKNEEGGKHKMGLVKVTSTEVPAGTTANVDLITKSYLAIDTIKVAGKESGKLSLKESTAFKVKVLNNFNLDVNSVSVTVKVLDVDGNNIEEQSDSEDINAGDSQDFTVDVDVSKEKIDQEDYTVEITAEGTGKDGSKQKVMVSQSVSVDLDKHKVAIKDATLTETQLSCSRETTMRVNLQNQGKNKENSIEVHVKNSALKLDAKQEKISLDKLTGDEPDYTSVLNIDASGAKPGSYPLTVEVYRDGTLDDTKTITLTLSDCGGLTSSSQSNGQSTFSNSDQATAMSVALQQQLQAKAQESQTVVKGSFRESDSYVMLLGVLGVLMFIALVLALAVLVMRKKK